MSDKHLKILKKIPLQKRSRELVLAILEGTDQLLKSSKSEQITAQKISDRAGVSIGSFYQYFKDKEQAFQSHLIDKLLRHQKYFIQEIKKLDDEPVHIFIEKFNQIVFTYFLENGTQLKNIYHRIAYFGQYEFMMDHRQEAIDVIASYLRKHKDELDPEIDIEHGAIMAVQASMGVFIHMSYYDKNKERILEELNRSLKSYFLVKKA